MDLGFTVRMLKEDGTFIAHVPELDVSSCAATEADARRNVADAVQRFLETAKVQGDDVHDWGATPRMPGIKPIAEAV